MKGGGMLMLSYGLYSGGVHEPLSDVAYVDMFTHTGGDLRSTLGRSAWMTVVTGSEWEVPPRLSALWGNVPMSVRSEVSYNGRHDVCQMRVHMWLTGEAGFG